MKLSLGTIDPSGHAVIKVYVHTESYIIYQSDEPELVDALRIEVEPTSTRHVEIVAKLSQKWVEAKGLINRSANIPVVKERIVQALNSALLSDAIDEEVELQDIINDIKRGYKHLIMNRLMYIAPAFLIAVITSVMVYLHWNLQTPNSFLWQVYLIGFGSSMGGLMSILYSIQHYNFEEHLGMFYNIAIGFKRIVISLVGGVIAYIGLKSSLLFPRIDPNDPWVLLLFMVLAGFSEAFVPNLLTQFTTKEMKKGK